MKTVEQIIHKAIKRHAGLSDFDDGPIAAEVRAILRALKREGLSIQGTYRFSGRTK